MLQPHIAINSYCAPSLWFLRFNVESMVSLGVRGDEAGRTAHLQRLSELCALQLKKTHANRNSEILVNMTTRVLQTQHKQQINSRVGDRGRHWLKVSKISM